MHDLPDPPDPAAFRQIVEQHQRTVYAIALRITCDPGLAEEVAQDAFLALYRTRRPPAPGDHTRFWLRKAATHAAIDALRRRAHQPEAASEEWLDEQHGFDSPWNHDPNLQSALEASLEARLDTLLRALPEALRVPVVLRYTEDLEPGEIALLLGQPVATVKSNLQRGLHLLRRKAAVTLKDFVRPRTRTKSGVTA